MDHLITYAGFTRLGLSYDHNEDVVVAEGAYFWSGEFAGSFSGAEMEGGGHFDGMGGNSGGEMASEEAARMLPNHELKLS